MNGNSNSEGRMKYVQCWDGSKFSVLIRKRTFMCIRTSVSIRLLPLYTHFMEDLWPYKCMFFKRKWEFLDPLPTFVNICHYFLLSSSPSVTAQKMKNLFSKRQTIKQILVLIRCFTKLNHIQIAEEKKYSVLHRLRHMKNKGVQQSHASSQNSEAADVWKVARHPLSRHVVACDDYSF